MEVTRHRSERTESVGGGGGGGAAGTDRLQRDVSHA